MRVVMVDGNDEQVTGILELARLAEGADTPGETLTAELELGKMLFSAGAPGQRILDSITFLNEKLRGGRIHTLLGFEALVIMMEQAGERRIAMCEYPPPTGVNATAISTISRYLHALPDGATPSRVLRELQSIKVTPLGVSLLSVAALTLFAVIFGYFNHADAWALVIIAIATVIALGIRTIVAGKGFGYYIAVLAFTLAAASLALLLSFVIPTTTPLVALIIPCVIVIPGFQLVNGGWEVLRNHLHIGIPRLMIVFNVFAIIAVGLLLVLLAYPPAPNGSGLAFPMELSIILATFLGALAALCMCVVMNAPVHVMLFCLFCGAIARFIRTVVVITSGDVVFGVFCGTFVISIIALLMSQHWKFPVVIPLVTASVQFVPGYYVIICLEGMTEIIRQGTAVPMPVVTSMISSGLLSLFISAAIVIGTLLPLLVIGKNMRWN
jgi:uncharacterized membrane protein YjjB (DUF3815 family)